MDPRSGYQEGIPKNKKNKKKTRQNPKFEDK
jgi:hypothetical protein